MDRISNITTIRNTLEQLEADLRQSGFDESIIEEIERLSSKGAMLSEYIQVLIAAGSRAMELIQLLLNYQPNWSLGNTVTHPEDDNLQLRYVVETEPVYNSLILTNAIGSTEWYCYQPETA